MSRLGLGLAALGRPGYLNLGHGADLGADRSVEALRARTHEVLDAAYEAGVRDFDAARSYGRGEEFLGELAALARRPTDVTISSKWGYVYTADWEVDADPPEVKHHDVETFRRQFAETRAQPRRLARPLPDPLGDAGQRACSRTTRVLSAMTSRPGCRSGSASSGVAQAETIDRAVALGIFSAVQATWNLHERAAGPALARAHAAGLKVIVKEAPGQRPARRPRRRGARRRARPAVGDGRAQRCVDRRDAAVEPARAGHAGARLPRAGRGLGRLLGAPVRAALELVASPRERCFGEFSGAACRARPGSRTRDSSRSRSASPRPAATARPARSSLSSTPRATPRARPVPDASSLSRAVFRNSQPNSRIVTIEPSIIMIAPAAALVIGGGDVPGSPRRPRNCG